MLTMNVNERFNVIWLYIKYVPNIYKFSLFAIKYICRYAAGMGQYFQLFNISIGGDFLAMIFQYTGYISSSQYNAASLFPWQILLNLNKVVSFNKNSLGIH